MRFNITEFEDKLVLSNLENFNLTHIFECGQAFRWEKSESGSYIVVHASRVIELVQISDTEVEIYNSNLEDFNNIWYEFFDLETDYNKLKMELTKTKAYNQNTSLKEAIGFGYGMRILRQEEFEMIISFIISANNQIPRIKNSIEIISRQYGKFIQNYKGKDYFSFPSPNTLSKVDPIELKEIARVGFRNERIVETSKIYSHNPEKFSNSLDDATLGDNLLSLPGVGPKVRDCILLFGYKREKTFPVDVWVKRLMETLYIHQTISNKKILEIAETLFGEKMGIAQQYLFYYARETKIGK